ncbi:hypothetical protein [Kitasatospora sp. NPDC018619]|uniref:hypothetical protein n=1 Tax=unclassified Kitasatospora TaxID=2633591 RepID=UPI00379AB456
MTGPAEQADGTTAPAPRSGRHAAPRTPVRVRLRGRALAMAAVPTALLMAAAYTPNPAVAESAAGKPCGTAPATVPDVAPIETPVPRSELPEPPGPSTGAGQGPTAAPAPGASTDPGSVPTGTPTTAPAQAPTAPAERSAATGGATGGATASGATVSSAVYRGDADGAGTADRTGLIDDLVNGVNRLFTPNGSPTPTPGGAPTTPAPPTGPATPTAPAPRTGTPAQPAQPQSQPPAAAPQTEPSAAGAATGAPSPAATPAATPSSRPKPSATPSAGAPATPSGTPSGTPTENPDCDVDARGLTAGAAAPGHVVPEQNWTLKTSRLALHGAAFHGVYDVRTPTGSKRVLKFVVDSVDIDNLDMSTLEGNGVTFHVQGGPGTTSTMRKGPITMYVERLSGHLSKVLGLPIPIDLGEITLTPDTLPRWLYDLIGAIPIPLDLELTGVTAKQAGQFGGTLHIPGMHLFNDDAPYSDK